MKHYKIHPYDPGFSKPSDYLNEIADRTAGLRYTDSPEKYKDARRKIEAVKLAFQQRFSHAAKQHGCDVATHKKKNGALVIVEAEDLEEKVEGYERIAA